MCKIDLIFLLLLVLFCNTLLLYSLVLVRTITAPDIPVRRNKQDSDVKCVWQYAL